MPDVEAIMSTRTDGPNRPATGGVRPVGTSLARRLAAGLVGLAVVAPAIGRADEPPGGGERAAIRALIGQPGDLYEGAVFPYSLSLSRDEAPPSAAGPLAVKPTGGDAIAPTSAPVADPPAAGREEMASATTPESDRPRVDPSMAEALAAAGLEPDGSGAAAYLSEYLSSLEGGPRAKELIADLGDPDYQVREAATGELLRLPLAPLATLRAARESPDAEVAWRAEMILERARPTRERLLLLCWQVLAVDPRPGILPDLCRVAEAENRPETVRVAGPAVAACLARGGADPADLALLRDRLAEGEESVVRRLALVGVETLDPEVGDPLLLPLIDDADVEVRLDALTVLARRADRRALAPLIELLGSGSGTRGRAFWVLYGLTGRTSGYSPYAAGPERRAALARWEDWLAREGTTATLRPLGRGGFDGRGELAGHTLIATGGNSKVYEVDGTGATVFEIPLNSWSAEKLPSGNVLIADHDGGRVLEVDFHTKKTVWEKSGFNPMNVKPLVNGHVLVADFSGGRAVELDIEHKVVWEARGHDDCFDVQRLPDGNTLVGCPESVKEIRPDNEVVRQWKIADRLNGFQLLADGHLLVANWGAKEIQEYDDGGEILWKYSFKDRGEGPCDVFRLPDGTTLITTDQRVLELAPDRKTLTVLGEASYGSARR